MQERINGRFSVGIKAKDINYVKGFTYLFIQPWAICYSRSTCD